MTENTNVSTANDETVADTTSVEPTVASPTEPKVELAKADNSLDAVIARSFDKLSKPKVEPAKVEPAAVAKVEPAAADGKVLDPVTGRTLEPIKAPVLPVSLRDKWASVPRDFQQYWADRERDMNVKLQETADDRKTAAGFKDVVGPYEAMLRQYNITAIDHTKGLFKLSHAMTTGTPQQKAQIFYELLGQYKPDPATLQSLLAGKPIQQSQQQPVDVKNEIDTALKARDETSQIDAGKAALETFKADPKHEFVEDVRDLMAKAIDAGFVKGSTWPELFKNAYDFACQQHPEVKNALAQRAAGAAVPAQAVPSIKPSLGSGNRSAPPKKKMNMQEALDFAWKQNGGA